MNKFSKPACLLLYLLAFLDFFLAGGFYVKFSGAANEQGFAAGAIVFVYGMIFAFTALVASFFVVHYSKYKAIVFANRLLLVIFIIEAGVISFQIINKDGTQIPIDESPKKVTSPVTLLTSSIVNNGFNSPSQNESEISIGLGFFRPDFYETPVLYFYAIPNLKKSVLEHPLMDSIVFIKLESGGFDILYAPPWLKPEHLKLDYDILYFKIQSLSNDFAEIIVNKDTQKTVYVTRNAGKIIFWPDFLLHVNSVEFLKPDVQKVRVKPLSYAGEVNTQFQFMKPIIIKDEWMFVKLLNEQFETDGQGWIQWRDGNELLISYSLLS